MVFLHLLSLFSNQMINVDQLRLMLRNYQRIAEIKKVTGQSQVNIVGHSKGGLDARVYLANGTHDIANLIMIGTPNEGSPLAISSDICTPTVYDLKPGAADTLVKMNPNTKYYTAITG